MTKERADLGFSDALDDFNPTEWAPKKQDAANDRPAAVRRVEKSATTKAAAASGFRSREPKPLIESGAGEGDAPRRRRTGRNAQFNLKARPETIAAFCAIADQQGWGLGETLEKAVAILEREYSRQ
jgi:hypothetical protein